MLRVFCYFKGNFSDCNGSGDLTPVQVSADDAKVKGALLKMLGWRILQGFQSLFHFLKKRCFHRLLREYPTDSLL